MFQFCYEFQLEGTHAGGEGDIFPVATGIATIRSGIHRDSMRSQLTIYMLCFIM